jgi:hypothetical protein
MNGVWDVGEGEPYELWSSWQDAPGLTANATARARAQSARLSVVGGIRSVNVGLTSGGCAIGSERVFATGQGRKTDATDAHSVALVGTRMAGLRPVVSDAQLRCCDCWWTGAARSGKSTPARSASCTESCWKCCPVARRCTSRQPKPARS